MPQEKSNLKNRRKTENKILIEHGFAPLSKFQWGSSNGDTEKEVSTILKNLMYYGFIPSIEAVKIMKAMSLPELVDWWEDVEPVVDGITGRCKDASDHIVYKNFPEEVLNKSDAEYWMSQVLMYLGAPVEWFAGEPVERDKMVQKVKFTVLQPDESDTLEKIATSLFNQTTKWVDSQSEAATWLYLNTTVKPSLSDMPFRENAIVLAKSEYEDDRLPCLYRALDVIRLAALLSGISIRVSAKSRFRNFSRKERRMFLMLLEECPDLKHVVADNKSLFKKFIARLHPYEGAIACPRVVEVHNMLYSGSGLESSNARYVNALVSKDESILDEVSLRPVVFMRKLTELYKAFGTKAVVKFLGLIHQLTTMQLLEIKSYVKTHNTRSHTLGFPNSSWSRPAAHPIKLDRVTFSDKDVSMITDAVSSELKSRSSAKYPNGVEVGAGLEKIYLPTNDIQLAPYGRGTKFSIPENIDVIRSNTFWDMHSPQGGNVWFDNGWSLYDSSFNPVSIMDWNSVKRSVDYKGEKLKRGEDAGAVFSGDPSSDTAGTQVIDLNIEKMLESGVRYAVWTVLSFSNIPFNKAGDVFAGLQFVEGESGGEVLEPSRCEVMFKLKLPSLSTIPCLVDLKTKEVIYLDAPCSMSVFSVLGNLEYISNLLPAVLDYIKSKPTLADLFNDTTCPKIEGTTDVNPTFILNTDEGKGLSGGSAYVFKAVNEESDYKPLSIQNLLEWDASMELKGDSQSGKSQLPINELAVKHVQDTFCSGYGDNVLLLGDLSDLLVLLYGGALTWEVKEIDGVRCFTEPEEPEMSKFLNERITKVGEHHYHVSLFHIPELIYRLTGVRPAIETLTDIDVNCFDDELIVK